MRKRKTLRTLLLLTVLFVLALAPMNAQAASQKSKALKAYQNLLKKSSVTLSGHKCKLSNAKFAVAYVDNNTVPELFLETYYKIGNNKLYVIALYTYKNGKATRVYTSIAGLSYYKCYYYKKTGAFLSYFSYGDYQDYYYYKISGTKSAKRLSKLLVQGTTATTYYGASGKKITKSTFNKRLKTLTKSKKATAMTLRKNTRANRTKYLK